MIVEGFMGFNSSAIWGNFEEHSNQRGVDNSYLMEDRQVIFARLGICFDYFENSDDLCGNMHSVGPVSSLHDRACELFYSLRGGTGLVNLLLGNPKACSIRIR